MDRIFKPCNALHGDPPPPNLNVSPCITVLPSVVQKRDWFLSIIELDDGKIYRKALYLMVKTMVSCRFSLKPIQWFHLLDRRRVWPAPSRSSFYQLLFDPKLSTGWGLRSSSRSVDIQVAQLWFMVVMAHMAKVHIANGVYKPTKLTTGGAPIAPRFPKRQPVDPPKSLSGCTSNLENLRLGVQDPHLGMRNEAGAWSWLGG